MPSATNLISFLRSVESHRSRVLPLKFAREVLWRPIFSISRTRSRTNTNRSRWVHDHMDECRFAPYARCRICSGGQSWCLLGVHRVIPAQMAACTQLRLSTATRRVQTRPPARTLVRNGVEVMNEILANKANQQCHLKKYRALDRFISTGIIMGAAPMTIPVDINLSS